MGNRSMFVGLDVHKETIDVSIAEGARQGEVRHYGVIASDRRTDHDAVFPAAGEVLIDPEPARAGFVRSFRRHGAQVENPRGR